MGFNWFYSIQQAAPDTEDIVDDLVTLIRVAQEDEVIYQRLNQVLNKPSSQRALELSNWITHCQNNHAPKSFVASLQLLLNDDIAKKALKAIQS